MKKQNASYMWTKESIKTLIKLWDTSTIEDIAEELGVRKDQVSSMARRVRKAGYELPRKSVKGEVEKLIKEAIGELKKKK